MPPVTMPPILPKGQAGSSMASSQSSSNKWVPLSFLSSWTSLPVCHSLCLCWTCPAMEGSVSLEMAPLCTERRVGLVCWLLQSVGEMCCSERETDLLAAFKVVGKWVVQREREWFAGYCKVLGKWVVQREREIETDLLAAAKWWGNGLFGERLICWLLQSIGGMGCSGREINLLAAVKQQGRGV